MLKITSVSRSGVEQLEHKAIEVELKILTNGLIHFAAVIILMYFETFMCHEA